ncbi:MAG: sigma-70 family RNA polymerase sigma factor [Gemmatimonadetes bacterium]|nr:sigma-70 family RNA polymerase sigma factor [Gemmatimonadota bacterium]
MTGLLPAPGVMMGNVDASDLFGRIARGDQRAVADCVQTFGGLVQALAKRWNHDPSDAEDAVQEIFIDLWKSAGRYDPTKCSPRGFVAMIARRRLIDRARRRGRAPVMVAMPDDFDAASEAAGAADVLEHEDAARRVLAELTPMQRRMLEMTLLDGKTHEEVALETDTPLGTVKSHVRRGLLRARALMGVGSSNEGGAP